MAEQIRFYMCKHFKWTSWNHYGVKMPELACKLKGGYMGSCQGICPQFELNNDYYGLDELSEWAKDIAKVGKNG